MKKEIGKRLRQIRETKELSQNDVGSHLGIQYQHVSKYERGESVPTWEYLIKLNELYHVNINWLLTGKGKMFLTPMGYEAIENEKHLVIKDVESDLEEIIEELKKDKELKTAIYNYIKGYTDTKRAASKLHEKAAGLVKTVK